MDKSDSASSDDLWLTSLFAAATGPFVDTAFAERILKRLRRKARVRLYVISGVGALAAALTIWLADLLLTTRPVFNLSGALGPDWTSLSGSTLALVGSIAALLATWLVVDES